LIYPPTGIYDRYERCQVPVGSESVVVVRPPLDLMYLAAVLLREGISVQVRDYPASGEDWGAFRRDVKEINPDLLLVSVTVHTLSRDVLACEIAKKHNASMVCICKGFSLDQGRQILSDYPVVDIVLRDEAEAALAEFVRDRPLSEIEGLSYRSGSGIRINSNRSQLPDLDALPFPARHLLNNELYKMPDNGRKMGLILLGKGCSHDCIFCLVPSLNRHQVRRRSPESVVAELHECVSKHGITDFWFRADNFTEDRSWVLRICDKIAESRLPVRWVTNSRVDSLDAEMILAMKKAGCFAIGLGVESGSEDTLKRIKKNISKKQAVEIVDLCRINGMQTYPFFVIGFPWETRQHIQETIKFAKQLKGDIVNFAFPMPFPGTELFDLYREAGLVSAAAEYSRGNGGVPLSGTRYLSADELSRLGKSAYRQTLFSPEHIIRSLGKIRSFRGCVFYLKAAVHLFKLSI